MLNNRDKKIKRLKTLYWIVGSLSGVLTVLLFSFFVMIIVSNNTSKPTAQEPSALQPAGGQEAVEITDSTVVIVNEYCLYSGEVYPNEQLAADIKDLSIPTLQGLNSYLVSRQKPIDIIQEFTRQRVVLEYTVDRSDKCEDDDSTYLVIKENLLNFHDGIPNQNNLIETLPDQVLIIDIDQTEKLNKGIKLEDYDLYLGLFNNSTLAVYNNQPTGFRPLFIFTNLSVKADSIDFLLEEEPFHSLEELLDLIEAYAR